MVNLFAKHDGQRFDLILVFVPFIIDDPFIFIKGVVHALDALIWLLGPHAAFGMLIFVLFYPVQHFVSRLTGYFRRRTLCATDQHIVLMNEFLQNIKLIKMNAWEQKFGYRIKDNKFVSVFFFRQFNFSVVVLILF
jgi:hypothetical protein